MRLHKNVSPRNDCTGANFTDLFIPGMLELAQECFDSRHIFLDWALSLINPLPKCTRAKLRPIALQDLKKQKVAMSIVCLRVQQIFQQLTHRR